jgi:hypothetical protein
VDLAWLALPVTPASALLKSGAAWALLEAEAVLPEGAASAEAVCLLECAAAACAIMRCSVVSKSSMPMVNGALKPRAMDPPRNSSATSR